MMPLKGVSKHSDEQEISGALVRFRSKLLAHREATNARLELLETSLRTDMATFSADLRAAFLTDFRDFRASLMEELKSWVAGRNSTRRAPETAPPDGAVRFASSTLISDPEIGIVHSHLYKARCKQVALRSTAATGGVKKPHGFGLGASTIHKIAKYQKRNFRSAASLLLDDAISAQSNHNPTSLGLVRGASSSDSSVPDFGFTMNNGCVGTVCVPGAKLSGVDMMIFDNGERSCDTTVMDSGDGKKVSEHEGIGVMLDGMQGPYSCECRALKVFDEMPKLKGFCGVGRTATGIRDKGGGLAHRPVEHGSVVNSEEEDEYFDKSDEGIAVYLAACKEDKQSSFTGGGDAKASSNSSGLNIPHHEDVIGFSCEMGAEPVTFANSVISTDVILDSNIVGVTPGGSKENTAGLVCMADKVNVGTKSMSVSRGSREPVIHSTKMPVITREVIGIGSLQVVKEFNVIKSATAQQDEMTSEYVRADEVEPPDKEHTDGCNGKENVVDIGVNGNQDIVKNYGTAENKLVRSLHAKMEQQIMMTDELCKEQLDSVCQFGEAKKSFPSTWLFGDKYGTGDDGVMLMSTSVEGSAPVAFSLSTLSTAAFGCNYKVTSQHGELALNGLWDDSGGLPTMKITVKSLRESCFVLEDGELIHKAEHMISDHKHSAIMLGLSHLLASKENFSEVTILHSRLGALLLCHLDVANYSAFLIPLGVANFNMSLTNWKVRLKVSTSSSEGNFDYDLHVASIVESMRMDAQNILVYKQVALSARHCFELLLSILNIDIVTVMPSFGHAWGFRVDHLGSPLPTSGHFELHLVQELLASQRCFLLVAMGSKRSVIVFVGRTCQQLLQPRMYLPIFTADSTKWTSFHTAVNKYCTGEMLTRFQVRDLPLLLLMPWFIHFYDLGNSEAAKTQPPSCRKALAELNQIIHLMVSQIFISRNPQYFRAALVGVWCYLVSCCCEDIDTKWLSQFPVVQFCILGEDAQILGSLVINRVSNTLMLVGFLLLLRSSFGSLDLQLAAKLVMCGDARDVCSMIGGNSIIDLVLWTAVIVGYYMHNGYSLEALELYTDQGWVGLLQHSITPPRVRLACAQSGKMCMGHCKKLAPILEEVAVFFEEVPTKFDVKYYPTLCIKIASGKLLSYDADDRSKEGLIASIDKNRDKAYKYLEMGLQNFQDYQVCSITVGVVGEIVHALDDKILPYCDGILKLEDKLLV